jgi:hypothetical protein
MEGDPQKPALRGVIDGDIEHLPWLERAINNPSNAAVGFLQYEHVAWGDKDHRGRLA